VWLIAQYAIAEALRRRVFTIIVVLTFFFLVLYAWGAFSIFDEVERQDLIGGRLLEEKALTGGTLTGLGMFVTFFLAVVLSVFMTMSAIRGDAERGVLQPLVVRPLGRRQVLLGRLAAAVAVAAGYAALVYVLIVGITWAAGDWTPDNLVLPAFALMAAVAIVTCISVLGSVHLTGTANGIAVFMIFGAGLTAGLLNQIGDALDSSDLGRIADVAAVLLPFEALYQAGLDQLTAETRGLTRVAVELGPFGGAESIGPAALVWCLLYPMLVLMAAVRGFARLDL
jgi:ABC-type transport system involved in multi-copper enzyme maturation permease subunit